MRAEELRIGNWVYLFGEALQLTKEHLIYLLQKDGLPEPITITEDWLLKFGFERVEHDERYWYKYPLGLISPMPSWEDKFYMMSGDHDLDVKYVHQLQNLYYALTNKDL